MAGESYTTKKILLKAVDGTTTQYFIPYVNNATADKTGLVKPDGTTITVDANGTISAQVDISGLQSKIDADHKLNADFILDGTTNKVVTATEKSTWNGKQDVISDLSTIRTNASNGASAYTTIASYGDIVTHNADEFANVDHTHSQYLTSVAWGDVTGKPSTFTPESHNQASNTINTMASYVKASSAAAIATTDSLNTAVGKLEYKIDDVDTQLQALTAMLNAAS